MEPLCRHALLDVEDLGALVPYADGLAAMRARGAALDEDPSKDAGTLLLLEHAPTITVTRSGGLTHLLVSPEALARDGFDLMQADRGGDVTFHGPGQLVGYPVVRLRAGEDGRADLVGYLRAVESALVRTCERLGVAGCHKKPGMTGVWVGDGEGDDSARKLVAIGVGVRRGVTRHGFALNVDIDLDAYTARITPCGLSGRGVTSLLQELGHERLPSGATIKSVAAEELASALGLSRRDANSLATRAVRPDGAFHV
jgi:lipoyl(octanoyl) transferase